MKNLDSIKPKIAACLSAIIYFHMPNIWQTVLDANLTGNMIKTLWSNYAMKDVDMGMGVIGHGGLLKASVGLYLYSLYYYTL